MEKGKVSQFKFRTHETYPNSAIYIADRNFESCSSPLTSFNVIVR